MMVLIHFAGYKDNFVCVCVFLYFDLQREYVNVQMSQEIVHKIKLHHKDYSDCRACVLCSDNGQKPKKK
jgi:hypothetical protein